jgi:hypothetical protein
MSNGLTPRIKRLLIATPFLCIIVLIVAPMLNSQTRNLRAIDKHIAKIAPQWDNFRATHPGFQQVELFHYTGDDGLFGAYGHVASDEQLAQLRKFMESTAPPRPVYLDSVHVTGPEDFDIMFGDKTRSNTPASNQTSPVPAPNR